MTEHAGDPTTETSRRDLRAVIAVPLIALAAALVGVGIYQLTGSDDPAAPVIETEVGGQQIERPATTSAPSTTVAVGDDAGLEVGGDQGQVGLMPAQTAER